MDRDMDGQADTQVLISILLRMDFNVLCVRKKWRKILIKNMCVRELNCVML